ncbi:MAG: hypothetical protein IT299_10435 [Dehalococcoidia bacterium]|nr:hypothetical protein [Dehalococcoidia bacterium]
MSTMITDALQRLARAFGNAMLMMAIADDEYWLARGQLVDPELARLLPGLADRSAGNEAGPSFSRGHDAVLEAEWLLAAAREDEAVPAA